MQILEFGPFRFDARSRELSHDGEPVHLPPRSADLLLCLLDRAGELTTKEQIIDQVWDGAFVMDHSITEAIRVLRVALGDDARTPAYIETLPRRGYRFIATVLPVAIPLSAPVSVHVPVTVPARARTVAAGGWWIRIPPARVLGPPTLLIGAIVVTTLGVQSPSAQPRFGGTPVAVTLEKGLPLNLEADITVRLTADDSSMIYRAGNRAGAGGMLYRRPLDQHGAVPIPGSEGALQPELSPDGSELAAFRQNGPGENWSYDLVIIPLGEGQPSVIARAGVPSGADWIDDSHIIYASFEIRGPLAGPERRQVQGTYIVSVDSGVVRPLTSPDPDRGEYAHMWPNALPGGRQALITIVPDMPGPGTEDSSVALVDLETGAYETLIENGAFGRYSPSGHIVFARRNQLFALAFNAEQGRALGQPQRVLDDVVTFGVDGAAAFDLSARHLVYLRGPNLTIDARLAQLFPGGGEPNWLQIPPADYVGSFTISPDGRYWGWGRSLGSNSRVVLDLYDTRTRTRTPYQLPGPFADFLFTDSNDLAVAFTNAESFWGLRRQRRDGSDVEVLVDPEHPVIHVTDRLADGSLLLVRWGGRTRYDIWRMPPEGPWEPILASPAPETCARVSPDGRWLAYASKEEDEWHVFVSPYPSLDGRIRVSSEPASSPSWARDGRGLYMATLSEDRRHPESILRLPWSTAGATGAATTVVEAPYAIAGMHMCRFAAAPDGSYFLTTLRVANRPSQTTELNLLVDWASNSR